MTFNYNFWLSVQAFNLTSFAFENRKRSSAAGERIRNHPHRNSASIAISGTGGSKVSSTLQEDLMKLIGPSELQNGDVSNEEPIQKPLRSRSKVIYQK